MTTISQVADRIGEHICKQAGLESELKKICFGIEVMLVMSVSILIILFFGIVLGVFKETCIITLTALFMKFIIGGPHLSGFFRCQIYSAILILSGASLYKIQEVWLTTPFILFILTLNLMIIAIFQLAPSYCIYDQKQTITRKFLAMFLVIITIISYLQFDNLFSVGALIGFTISIINISPVGTSFVRWLDRITKQGGVVQ